MDAGATSLLPDLAAGGEPVAIAAAVAAITTSVLFILREIIGWLAGGGGVQHAVRRDREIIERHGLAMLRAAQELSETLTRFLRHSDARWYTDPLDPGLTNALHHQMAVFFAYGFRLRAQAFPEFTGQNQRGRRFSEALTAIYDAVSHTRPPPRAVAPGAPKNNGILRREDLDLLGERMLHRTASGPQPFSYAAFMERFVDLGVGARPELEPLIYFFTAAERGGPRRSEVVMLLIALAAFHRALSRFLGLKPTRSAAIAVPGLHALDAQEHEALRREAKRFGLRLNADDNPPPSREAAATA